MLTKLLRILALCAGCTACAHAQEYPVRGVRYVVPTTAGGSSDTLARVIAPRLADALGQAVVIDNRPGANGIIGSELVAKAASDGYTFLQAATSHATNPALGVKLPYDTLRDFAPVTLLSQQPNLWIAHPSLPAANIKALIALAKARPAQIDFASSGSGSSQHLAGELLNVLAGIQLTSVRNCEVEPCGEISRFVRNAKPVIFGGGHTLAMGVFCKYLILFIKIKSRGLAQAWFVESQRGQTTYRLQLSALQRNKHARSIVWPNDMAVALNFVKYYN